jgi:hypothetical protein
MAGHLPSNVSKSMKFYQRPAPSRDCRSSLPRMTPAQRKAPTPSSEKSAALRWRNCYCWMTGIMRLVQSIFYSVTEILRYVLQRTRGTLAGRRDLRDNTQSGAPYAAGHFSLHPTTPITARIAQWMSEEAKSDHIRKNEGRCRIVGAKKCESCVSGAQTRR